ncbi:MAG: hypothetical protein J6Y93_07405 [Treponema sp.]|nr:hypothetical protein [Treponema sp.]
MRKGVNVSAGIKFLPLLFLIGLFSSCDFADPEILEGTASLVVDYENEHDKPSATFSVFLQMNNELQRTDIVEVKDSEGKYSWNVVSPELFSSDGKKWVGCTHLVYPDGEKIKKGRYSVLYTDAADNQLAAEVELDYPDSLLTCRSSEARNLLTGKVTENIALYDKDKVMIFYGKKKTNWRSGSDITNSYKDCVYRRMCYSTDKNKIICLMPLEQL